MRPSSMPLTLSIAAVCLMIGCQPAPTSSQTSSQAASQTNSQAAEPNSTADGTSAAAEISLDSNITAANTSEAQPVEAIAVPPAIFTEGSIAIRGADPVAYFTQNRYVPGSAGHTYEWANTTWQFSSAENRNLFADNPTQYAPQYGGFCAWAVAEGYTASVDPNAWEIVDGKLYLNYDARIQRRWQQDIPGNVARADGNWPNVLN